MTANITVVGWKDARYIVDGNEVTLRSPAGLTGTFTEFADHVHLWCFETNVKADLVEKWSDGEGTDFSRWSVQDEAHRTMFIMRWS